jgi:hypothetical protein
MAQSKDSIETRNKAIIQESFDAWKAGTGGPYELLADARRSGMRPGARRTNG